MSRRFIEKEGASWVDKGIISRAQYDEILGLYADKKHAVSMLPLLGSILIGLGVLSFVAANWQGIPQIARLILLLVVMSGFYWAGESFVRRGQQRIGVALVAIGLFSFGGSTFLIAQMFHLTSNNVGSYIAWSAAGIAVTFLYRSRFLFLFSMVIVQIAQLYSVNELHAFSYAIFTLMLVGLGAYAWLYRDVLLTYLMCAGIFLHTLYFLGISDLTGAWFLLVPIAVYAAGDWATDRETLYPLQAFSLLAAFLNTVWLVFAYDDLYFREHYDADARFYIPLFLILLTVSLWGKLRAGGRNLSMLDWLLFLPLFYIRTGMDVYYLIALFLFSLYVLLMGYREQWRFKINLGIVLFLFSTLLAYGKLTWGFMDKSVFFLIGGIILLSLGWFLNKQKIEALAGDEGGDGDDKR